MITNKSNEVRGVVKDIIIKHSAFQQMQTRLEQYFRDAQAHIPLVALFTGETGTGKTTAITSFLAKHPQERTPDGLMTPVMCINTPAKPTPRGIGERILRSLGDPRPNAGSASAKMDRIIQNLRASQVLMLLLDDIHHFVDKRQQIAIFDSSDYLKELIISSGIALIGLGLPESELVIESNEQLKTRSKAIFKLERFDWVMKPSQSQFVAVLKGFMNIITIRGFELPALDSPDVSLRMYLATGGLIRYVAMILSTALGNAIDTGTTIIRLEDLSSAWLQEVVGAGEKYENPFSSDFKLTDLADKVAIAKKIGERIPRPTRVRARKASSLLAEIGL